MLKIFIYILLKVFLNIFVRGLCKFFYRAVEVCLIEKYLIVVYLIDKGAAEVWRLPLIVCMNDKCMAEEMYM
jgi:hypothetical protein